MTIEFKTSLDYVSFYCPVDDEKSDERAKSQWREMVLLRYTGEVVELPDNLIATDPAKLEVAKQRRDKWTDTAYYYLADGEGELNLVRVGRGSGGAGPINVVVYKGSFKKGLRDGQGEGVVAGGRGFYKGGWKKGQRHGTKCEMTLFEESNWQKVVYKYFGDYVDDTRESSSAVLETGSGARYEGPFENDEKCGHGRQSFTDGSAYIGDFKNNKRHGYGDCHFGDGSRYSGQWKEGGRSGVGSLVMSDYYTYTGEWVADKRTGQGQLLTPSGTVFYEGGFLRNKFHGQGKLTISADVTYQGGFSFGKKHGVGVFSEPGPRVFRGRYQDDLKHGTGVLELPESVTTGVWKEDKLNGTGSITYRSGGKLVADFKDGHLTGRSVYIDVGGKTLMGDYHFIDVGPPDVEELAKINKVQTDSAIENYEGMINEEGQPDGRGYAIHSSGWEYRGEYRRGVRHGHGVHKHLSDGVEYKGHYRHGKRDGQGALRRRGATYHGLFRNDKPARGTAQIDFEDTFFGDAKPNPAPSRVRFGRPGMQRSSSVELVEKAKAAYDGPRLRSYKGECAHGWPLGDGTFTLQDGVEVSGCWNALQLTSPTATVRYTDGAAYVGEWESWSRCGTGQLTLPDGSRISGDFLDDILPSGEVLYVDGNLYRGELQDFKPNGAGELVIVGGGTWTGFWCNGQRSGIGKMQWPDGRAYEQCWMNGVLESEHLVETKSNGL